MFRHGGSNVPGGPYALPSVHSGASVAMRSDPPTIAPCYEKTSRLLCELADDRYRSASSSSVPLRVRAVLQGTSPGPGVWTARISSAKCTTPQPAVAVPYSDNGPLVLRVTLPPPVSKAEQRTRRASAGLLPMSLSWSQLLDAGPLLMVDIGTKIHSSVPDIALDKQQRRMQELQDLQTSIKHCEARDDCRTSTVVPLPRVVSCPELRDEKGRMIPHKSPAQMRFHAFSGIVLHDLMRAARQPSLGSEATVPRPKVFLPSLVKGGVVPMEKMPVPQQHVLCLQLPDGLDRLYLALPAKDQPTAKEVQEIASSGQPGEVFASTIIGATAIGEIQQDWDSQRRSFKVRHDLTTRRLLAALTAMWGNKCAELHLSTFDPRDAASLLSLWPALRSLGLHSPAYSPALKIVGAQLISLELHGTADPARMMNEARLPLLQRLVLSHCSGLASVSVLPPCPALQVFIVEMCEDLRDLRGLRTVPSRSLQISGCGALESVGGLAKLPKGPSELVISSCAILSQGIAELAEFQDLMMLNLFGQRPNRFPIADLVCAARGIVARQGTMVWPSREIFERAMKEAKPPFTQEEQAKLNQEMKKVAEANLQTALTKVTAQTADVDPVVSSTVLASSIAELKDSIKYARSFGVPESSLQLAMAQRKKLEVLHFASMEPVAMQNLQTILTGNDVHTRFKRICVKVLCCCQGSQKVDRVVCSEIIQGSPWCLAPSAAEVLLDYLDTEMKGFITERDICFVAEHEFPASLEELHDFYVFLVKNFGNIETAFKALAGTNDLSDEPEGVQLKEFEDGLASIGWTGKSRAIFSALDGQTRSGSIDKEEFKLLHFFENIKMLRAVEDLKNFLVPIGVNHFGIQEKDDHRAFSMIFRKIDDNKSGAISLDELQKLLKKFEYPCIEDVEEAFRFLDRDRTDMLSKGEWEILESLDTKTGLQALRTLRTALLSRYGSLSAAFNHLVSFKSSKPGSRKPVQEKSGKNGAEKREGNDCSLDEKTLETALTELGLAEGLGVPLPVLFQLLDGGQDRGVTEEDFLRLECLSVEVARGNVGNAVKQLFAYHGKEPKNLFADLRRRARERRLQGKGKSQASRTRVTLKR